MKQIFYIFLFFCLGSPAFPQIHFVPKEIDLIERIDLTDKLNRHLKIIPSHLVSAFCEGTLPAYFPKKLDEPVDYTEFLKHFGMGYDPSFPDGDILPCDEVVCLKFDQEVLDCFSVSFDIMEERISDNRAANMVDQVYYIRLIYSSSCTRNKLEYEGPVFLLKDILAMEKDYYVPNPSNDAANFTLKQVFLNKLYKKHIIYKGGDHYVNPEKKPLREKENKINSEGTRWED